MIEIHGGKPYQQKRVRSVAGFCIRKLVPRMRKLEVEIYLSSTLEKRTETVGSCTCVDDGRDPRYFVIDLDSSKSLRTLLLTLAHEMVHVKQFARNEQEYTPKLNKIRWHGKMVDLSKTDYWDLPWEIEANGREIGLFVQWCRENSLSTKKWIRDQNDM
jgi:hypothetical protein